MWYEVETALKAALPGGCPGCCGDIVGRTFSSIVSP